MNKRLYRSRKEVMIAGVCGGVSEYFDIDPVIVRLITVLLVFAGGAAILVYLLAWLIIPKAPEGAEVTPAPASGTSEAVETKTDKGRLLAGVILIILGFIFLASNFLPWFNFGKLWPLLLIVIGIVVLFKSA